MVFASLIAVAAAAAHPPLACTPGEDTNTKTKNEKKEKNKEKNKRFFQTLITTPAPLLTKCIRAPCKVSDCQVLGF
jgi:hypothetical protein